MAHKCPACRLQCSCGEVEDAPEDYPATELDCTHPYTPACEYFYEPCDTVESEPEDGDGA